MECVQKPVHTKRSDCISSSQRNVFIPNYILVRRALTTRQIFNICIEKLINLGFLIMQVIYCIRNKSRQVNRTVHFEEIGG